MPASDLQRHTHSTPAAGPAAHAHGATPSGLGSLRMLSVSHRHASIDQLESVAFGPAVAASLARALGEAGIPAVALSTCGRTELYWRSQRPEDDARAEAEFRQTAGSARVDGNGDGPAVRLQAEPVARHLFRVACGLESQVVGESEILGQVREALEGATPDSFLEGVFRAALRCGGRARTETGIGSGAMSVASVGAQMLVHDGKLAERRVLVLGAGDTGLKAARHLRAMGVGSIVVLNRTLARAHEAAAALDVEAAPLDELPMLLQGADAVIAASHAPNWLLTRDTVANAMKARPARPLTVIDVSMPRAVDPAVGGVAGVCLQDLSRLEQMIEANRDSRAREIPRVEELIEHELRWLNVWAHQEMIRPVLAEMRRRIESIRAAELEHARRDGVQDLEAVDRLTRRLVDRLLAIPAALFRGGELGLDEEHVRYMRSLFAPPMAHHEDSGNGRPGGHGTFGHEGNGRPGSGHGAA